MTRAAVEAHLAALEHPLAPALAALCETVRSSDPRISEEIKWNSPSFAIRDHFATTNLRPGWPLLLVLHAGVKKQDLELADRIGDPVGLLAWKSSDRAVIEFADLDSVLSNEAAVRLILTDWIAATQDDPV